MLAEFTLLEWLPFAAVMLVAGLVHGTLGLGFPLVATPMLALMVDLRSAILITLLPTVAVNLASIARGGNWSRSLGRFWPMAGYALLGSLLGAWVIASTEPAPFKLVLAALVLLYLGADRFAQLDMRFVGRHFKLAMLAFGVVAGFAAGSTNVMVPILIIYTLELGLSRTVMVQVFNTCFLSGKLAQIVVFAALGLLGLGEILSTLPLAVVALAALLVGMRLQERIPTETYRTLVKTVLFLLALVLVGQYVVSDVHYGGARGAV